MKSITTHHWYKEADGAAPPQSQIAAGRHNIWEYIKRPEHFAIIGAPASRKTTLLRHIAITIALTNSQDLPQTLPVLLYLRRHAKAIPENQDLSLQEVIHARTDRTFAVYGCPALMRKAGVSS